MSSCKVNWHVESSLIFQVQPDAAKIVCVDEHPANPWIVTCHDNGLVKLWNYQQNKLLHTFNLEKDDSLKREKLQRLIPLNQQSKSFEKPKLGVIHSVRFFDTDVQKYRFLTAQRIAAREGVQLNLNTDFHFCSWIVVNADNRIIFLNYITLQQKELKLSDLDGKVQNCFTPLGVGPLIAFGGVDGVIRVWDSRSWSVVDRLSVTSGHKSVQHILAVINAKGEPVIVSGGSEGHLFWWRGSGTPIAKKSLGEITDLSYNPITGEVISSSNDKSHNLVSWHNIMTGDFEGQVKERLSAKTVYNRVSRFSHPRFPFHSLLACTSNDSRIFLLNKDGSASELFDISELPAGRKQSKIYDLRSHPNFPHLVFCCTRTSFYVMSISASCTPPYSLTQPKERKSGSRRHSPKVVYLASGAPTQLIVSGLKKKGKSLSQKLSYPYARLSSSNSGRYLGVFSPEEEYYQILDLHNYDKSSSTWNVIGEGKARDLVWFGPKDQDMFCIIGLKTEEKEEKIKKNRLIIPSTNKRITVEKQIQELQMGKIDDNAKITYVPTPSVSNCEVTALHGGLVIGFHLDAELHNPILDLERAKKKETNSSSSVRSKNSSTKKKNSTISFDVNPSPVGDSTKSNDRCMRWIFETDPGTVQKIDCPNPLWLLWDPLERYCLLVYSHHFTIVELRPNFKPLFHSRIQILSAVWYKNALIYYTGNTIECKFLGMIPLIIASSDAEVALDLMEQYDSENIAQHIVPLGALSLIEVNDDILYAIDSISNIYQFPLSSPQIQFYFLVAGDQPKSAIELVDSFPENQHISLAQFLCSSGYAEDAVQIKSLSALTRIKICKQYELKDCIPSLIDEFNEEAAKSGTQEEAVKFIRQLCTELQNDELCLNILMKAVQMDETFEKDIILHYAATGAKKKLRSMYDELLEKKKYDSCVFCAQFLNETKLLSQVLQESSQIADYVAFFANDSGVDIESISQQLDIALQKDQPNNRDEYCTTDDDLQQ